MLYMDRDYRQIHRQEDLVHFQVAVKETDLDVGVRKDSYRDDLVSLVEELALEQRGRLEDYIACHPEFIKSLIPIDTKPGAPAIAVTMAGAARAAGVGPMAAVAGAFAEAVGRVLLKFSRDVIVENGGDIFLRTRRTRRIGIFAGSSVLSHRVGLEIRPDDTPAGICTSSGTVGHSLSLGCADAVVVISPSTPLADAVATATGNLVRSPGDLEQAVDFASSINGITGAVIILGDKIAVKGRIRIIPV